MQRNRTNRATLSVYLNVHITLAFVRAGKRWFDRSLGRLRLTTGSSIGAADGSASPQVVRSKPRTAQKKKKKGGGGGGKKKKKKKKKKKSLRAEWARRWPFWGVSLMDAHLIEFRRPSRRNCSARIRSGTNGDCGDGRASSAADDIEEYVLSKVVDLSFEVDHARRVNWKESEGSSKSC